MSYRQYKPVLVIGCGRSGTSTVARILHNRFNVKMGETFEPPNDANPQGYYEDTALHYANRKLTRGLGTYPEWFYFTQQEIKKRYEMNRPWGLKVNGLTYLLGLYDQFIPDAYYIWVVRNLPLVAKSHVRWWEAYKDNEKLARKAVVSKMVIAKRHLKRRDRLLIYFGCKRRTDNDIAQQIGDKWPILNDWKTSTF